MVRRKITWVRGVFRCVWVHASEYVHARTHVYMCLCKNLLVRLCVRMCVCVHQGSTGTFVKIEGGPEVPSPFL